MKNSLSHYQTSLASFREKHPEIPYKEAQKTVSERIKASMVKAANKITHCGKCGFKTSKNTCPSCGMKLKAL